MKGTFYKLGAPYPDERYELYGQPDWEERFDRATWGKETHYNPIVCPIDPTHPRVSGRCAYLSIVLPFPEIGDFVWTSYSEAVVPDRTLSLFKNAGFTGFEARSVKVEKIEGLSRKQSEQPAIPPLWELVITGQGGDAAAESKIRLIDHCEGCGYKEYSSFHNGIVVDETNWDGSDFFTVNGYTKFILVTERVKNLIMSHQLTNCVLIPSHELQWRSGFRPEEWLEEKRKMASRELSSLLADLENPDESNLMGTIDALGERMDPIAVDPLIMKFSHTHPLIWYAAALAVGRMAGHRDTPEPIRSGIFSKLANLLSHENPQVRKTAATAFGDMAGDSAAREVMRLFEDPEESVRQTGVFVIGFLRYKPALSAVKRLTRDPSKSVRKTAKRVVRELSSEFC
jgi:hypothetical protein